MEASFDDMDQHYPITAESIAFAEDVARMVVMGINEREAKRRPWLHTARRILELPAALEIFRRFV